MPIRVHKGDLPDLARYTGSVAIDTETLGLDTRRDRLCVVQLSPGDGSADVVQIAKGQTDAPNLKALLSDDSKVKIFHYARFDMAVLKHRFGIVTFAPSLANWYRDSVEMHGLWGRCAGIRCCCWRCA